MKKVVVLAALGFVAMAGQAFAAGNAGDGEKVFNKCKACHAVGEGAANKVGPELNGIVGRPKASIAAYTGYSAGLKAKGGDWTEADLTTWLKNPKAYVADTKMSFVGLNKDQDIEDVIAYLGQFGADGKKK